MTSPPSAERWSMDDGMTVRPYAVAGGRTVTPHSADLSLETQLEPGTLAPSADVVPEAVRIFDLCRPRRRSLAELAGLLAQPVPVVKVLVADLVAASSLRIAPASFETSPQVLRAALAALRSMKESGVPKAC